MPVLPTVEVEAQRAALDAARKSAEEVIALADLSIALQRAYAAEVTSPTPNNASAPERDVAIRFSRKCDADAFLSALVRVTVGHAPASVEKK